ncbi:MAG: (4Fe-4S)-binding protein, partial [candidate division Zixibacteria bacterium]|nr:(4Fe-4S)-binding protein [candidate division Zixibacteria bacterium]
TEKITKFCQREKIEIAGKIPFDNAFTRAMVEGKIILEYTDSKIVEEIKNIWKRIYILTLYG